jgi:hypothetical protein
MRTFEFQDETRSSAAKIRALGVFFLRVYRSLLDRIFPVGHEDEGGFHFDSPESEEESISAD